MIPCRRHCRYVLALAFAVLVAGRGWLGAADNPQGKQIAQIIPLGNKLHGSQQILDMMHTKAGKTYDEATIQEDVRRLYNTRWFSPSGIRVLTTNETDGRTRKTQPQPLPQKAAHELSWTRPERHADADLARALRDGIGRQAIDANRRQCKGQAAKYCQH